MEDLDHPTGGPAHRPAPGSYTLNREEPLSADPVLTAHAVQWHVAGRAERLGFVVTLFDAARAVAAMDAPSPERDELLVTAPERDGGLVEVAVALVGWLRDLAVDAAGAVGGLMIIVEGEVGAEQCREVARPVPAKITLGGERHFVRPRRTRPRKRVSSICFDRPHPATASRSSTSTRRS